MVGLLGREGAGPAGSGDQEAGPQKKKKADGPKAEKGEGKKKKFLFNFLNTFSNQIQFKFKSFSNFDQTQASQK